MKKFMLFVMTVILTAATTIGVLYGTKSFDLIENNIEGAIKIATNDYLHDEFEATDGTYKVTVDEQHDGSYMVVVEVTAEGGVYKLEGVSGTPTVTGLKLSFVLDQYNDDVNESLKYDYARITEV